MNIPLRSLAMALAFAVPIVSQSAPPEVAAPSKRLVTLELAAKLTKLPSEDSLKVPDNVRNPFNPAAAVSSDVRVNRPASDAELLGLLMEQLNPTGTLMFGDSPILLLGQKKVKLTEHLTLYFDGVPYDVELVGIDRNSFTLRLNKADVTRPIIKAGKN